VLAIVGLLVFCGRQVKIPRLTTGGRGRPLTASFGSMAGFGAGYAVASLTCTIAPFLAVVVAGFRTESTWVGLALFLAYAAGMGLVVGTVAVATALTSDRLIHRMRRSGQWVPRVSGLLLLLAGSYVAYYGWWELRVLDGGETRDPVIEFAARIQHAMAGWVEAPGAWGWLVGGLLLVGVTVAASRGSRRS
jgi:hypothetical protein